MSAARQEAEKRRSAEAEAEQAKKAKKAGKMSSKDHPARGHSAKSLDRSFSDLSDISESDFVPGLYAAKRKKELAEKRNRELRDQENGGQDKQKDIVKMPKNPTLEGLRGGEADLSDTLGGTGVIAQWKDRRKWVCSNLQGFYLLPKCHFCLRGADEIVEVPEVGTSQLTMLVTMMRRTAHLG